MRLTEINEKVKEEQLNHIHDSSPNDEDLQPHCWDGEKTVKALSSSIISPVTGCHLVRCEFCTAFLTGCRISGLLRSKVLHLSPAASFSIAALRSSAFCCERRRTFLSSWRWSRVPTSSPFTVFIWLSSICVWWREFLLYRLLERTFSSRSSTEPRNIKRCHWLRSAVRIFESENMKLESLVCNTHPCSPGIPCSSNQTLSSCPAGSWSAGASSPSWQVQPPLCRCPDEFSASPAPSESVHFDTYSCWGLKV